MATTFAERWQRGVGLAGKLVEDAREALPERSHKPVTARLAIERHPFAATAVAFGIGAMIGVAVGRLAGTCAGEARSTRPAVPEDVDPEC